MSTSNVTAIGGLTPPDMAVPEVVELLETMLARARSGEVRSVAVMGVTANEYITSAYHSEFQYYTLLGAVSRLQHRMLVQGEEYQ